MKSKNSKSQRGIVALVTVIFTSILFSVIVVAMFGVIASEERQASQADLSNRAYFAAESGVESGLLKIKTALASCTTVQINSNSCASLAENTCLQQHTTGPSGSDYTCLDLTHITSEIHHSLTIDGTAYQVDLSSVPNISKIVISWHIPGSSSAPGSATDGNTYSLLSPGSISSNTTFPSGTSWNYPALLEVQSILFNARTSTYNANSTSDLKIIEDTLAPTLGGPGVTTEYDLQSDSTTPSSPLEASCTAAAVTAVGGYACSETINIPQYEIGDYLRILRLRARYAGTHFSIQVYSNGSATPVSVPDSYESIDVTAKSGNVYSRVRAEVSIQQSTVALDYALFSDTNICHDFELRDSRSGNFGTGGTNVNNVGSCPF